MTTATSHHTPLGEQLSTGYHHLSDVLSRVIAKHRSALVWLLPVLAIGAVAMFLNMAGSPQRIDDEGTYTAQAYAVNAFGQLAHYTYWYDHPPLGWLQIAGYTQLTGAFARYSVAVLAGREAVIMASLVAVVLLWALARRIGLSRPAAAAASLIFALSPLAVQFHRTVYLDNVATPWLIAAFLLALSRKQQLAGFAASAACFSVAVLSKETFLIALPFLIWVMLRSSHRATRRYTLSVAGSVLVLVGSSYLLLAIVKGELLPGKNRVSLTDGILFQLASRASSGSVFDPTSLINRTFAIWWKLDPAFIVLGILAGIVGLFITRLRPFAALLIFAVLFMFRPGGYLPVPYVIMLLPFAALLIAATTDASVRSLRLRVHDHRQFAGGRARPIAWTALAAVALLVAAPLWTVQLRGLFLADLDAPGRAAEQWVETNVDHNSRLIVDDSLWVDLVRGGFDRDNVVWYYKVDTDPAVEAQSPQGWKDSDYIITTDSMRTFPDAFPQVQKAINNSTVVASFGSGTQAVDVRRINPGGQKAAKTEAKASVTQSAAAGEQLVTNPRFSTAKANENLLTGGRVDQRIILAIGSQVTNSSLTVSGFPALNGEGTNPRREVVITKVGGKPAADGTTMSAASRAFVAGLTGEYAPSTVSAKSGELVLTYPVATASGVIR